MARVGFLSVKKWGDSLVDQDIAVYDSPSDISAYPSSGTNKVKTLKLNGNRYIGVVATTDTGSHPMYSTSSPTVRSGVDGKYYRMLKRSNLLVTTFSRTSQGSFGPTVVFPPRCKLVYADYAIFSNSGPGSGGGGGGAGTGWSLFSNGNSGGGGGGGGTGIFASRRGQNQRLRILEDSANSITIEGFIGNTGIGSIQAGGAGAPSNTYDTAETGHADWEFNALDLYATITIESTGAGWYDFDAAVPDLTGIVEYGGLGGKVAFASSGIVFPGAGAGGPSRYYNNGSLIAAGDGNAGGGGIPAVVFGGATSGGGGGAGGTLTLTSGSSKISATYSPAAGGAGGAGGGGVAYGDVITPIPAGASGSSGAAGAAGAIYLAVEGWA